MIIFSFFFFKPTSASDVDYRIMTNFVDFYTSMLGFINFRLYHSINLQYPPKLPGITGTSSYLIHYLKSKFTSHSLLVKEDATDEDAVEEYNELVAALNSSLVTNVPQAEEEVQIDEFPSVRKTGFRV